MNIEKKPIQLCTLGGDELFGRIELDKCAIPESVRVILCGEPLIPDTFDCFGHPIFTKEQALIFMYQRNDLSRQNGGEFSPLKAEVIYEEKPFTASRNSFDTVAGIRKSLSNLKDLNDMLDNRRVFNKIHRNTSESLHEFLIFGCMCLDQFGQVLSLHNKDRGKIETRSDVEEMESFWKRNISKKVSFTTGGYVIPGEGITCRCCGKTLTIEDIKKNPIVRRDDDKLYHESCWKKYRKLKEIDKFTSQMISPLYKDSDYVYELIPNRYWYDCDYIPWFLFHTIDGDIIMGWRKRVISIEWQANYKPFDFNELFKDENVTKWVEGGRRGIHAWSIEDAFRYLNTVLQTVNPGYSKY